ncbi:S-layer homology domain-containing protein [Psychrobacillus sp. OK028]|uniref:S-layer homology domain-containing protein n=1 Tax=Psychrobacillus sp. OK028 TaxID=1884359 RepID=UPI0008804FC0|nr:S-layer homology domain-containing protein [Psychrobacillus sp. OK028]SDM35346.1 S-layer homology domain-containing protein [Psychrobacillus sp. OK028]
MNNKNKKWKVAIASALIASSLVITAPIVNAASPFKDLKKGTFSYEEIVNLANRGIIGGYADGTYRPAQAVTRGQSAKLLAEILDLDLDNVKDPKFKDVPQTHPYYAHIAALANLKVISGYKNGNFGPNDKLKRNQMAKILSEAFDFNTKTATNLPFKDVNPKDKEAKYIQALLDMKITTGTTSTTFSPNGIVTRGQMATFIYRSDLATKGTYVNAQIKDINKGNLITTKGTYPISDSLKKTLLTEENINVLIGAEIDARLLSGIVSGIDSLVVNASGNSVDNFILDGKNTKISGNITVQGDNVRLKNVEISGDFTVGASIQNSFTAENITVKGNTYLNNSIRSINSTIVFKDSTLLDVFANKKGASLILEDRTKVRNIEISQNTNLFAEDKMKLTNVKVKGSASEVDINAPVTNLEITSSNQIYMAGTGLITNMYVDTASLVNILNTGKINNLFTSRNSWIYLGTNTSILNLDLPLGMSGNEVIYNFYNVLNNIQKINGKKNTDYMKPTTPPTNPTPPPVSKVEASVIIDQINALNRYRSTYISDVRSARAAYNSLAAKEKKAVNNLYVLELAEQTIISNNDQLKEALNNQLDYIVLANDIILTQYAKITSPMEINGNNRTVTLQNQTALTDPTRNSAIVVQANNVKISNLTIDVSLSRNAARLQTQPMYIGLEIDNKSGIVLDNMTFRNGHAGIFVQAKTNDVRVTATNITTNNHSVGGIGINVLNPHNVTLTIKADGNSHTPTTKPAIWAEGGGNINVTDQRYIPSLVGNEIHYYKQ